MATGTKQERVRYVLPRNTIGSDDCVTVILNGVAYQVTAGQEVSIPVGVAEILDESVRSTRRLEEKIRSLQRLPEERTSGSDGSKMDEDVPF